VKINVQAGGREYKVSLNSEMGAARFEALRTIKLVRDADDYQVLSFISFRVKNSKCSCIGYNFLEGVLNKNIQL
jgi:hypothetical protein